jgi:predicted nuclease with TOPRIM domain
MSLLGEVNTEALILLHKRNQEIHSTVRELVDQNQDLKSSVNSLETTLKKSDARIEELQSKNNELLRNLSVVKQESHLMKENSESKNFWKPCVILLNSISLQ